MKIVVASGKGGTGKTTFATNLAWCLRQKNRSVRLLDADVEEPNAHLFLNPSFADEKPVEVPKPVWDAERCTGCGACAEACKFNALAVVNSKVILFNELCHACGVCSQVCPSHALTEVPFRMGRLRLAPETDGIFFADGLLNLGEPSAPAVVKALNELIAPDAVCIMDAAPGTGCPVVEALKGADVAVLVTEPTPFGLHDLKLAVGLALKLGVPAGIVVNRSDGAEDPISEYARSVGVPVLGRISFLREYAEAYSRGELLAKAFPELQSVFLSIFENIQRLKGVSVSALPEPPPPESAPAPTSSSSGKAGRVRELAVISGKGGTGKTTIAAALLRLAKESVMADNDVDAADLHLLLKPKIREVRPFFGGEKYRIDPERCIGCGACVRVCHFDSVAKTSEPCELTGMPLCEIDETSCEGCSLCAIVCPAKAIFSRENRTGERYLSQADGRPMVHARLGIAEENSGKLVSEVRRKAAKVAGERGFPLIIADGPPGTGCPVIASVTGVDHVLVVTEPTVSGVHDLERILALCRHFEVPVSVLVNKADLNPEQSRRIREIAEAEKVSVIGEIPFDRCIHDALMAGKTIIDHGRGPSVECIRDLWSNLRRRLGLSIRQSDEGFPDVVEERAITEESERKER